MTIRITCGSCHAELRVKGEPAGVRGTCPRRRAPVEVPVPLAPARQAAAPTAAR